MFNFFCSRSQKTVIFVCRPDGSVLRKLEDVQGHTRLCLARNERTLAYTQETAVTTVCTVASYL